MAVDGVVCVEIGGATPTKACVVVVVAVDKVTASKRSLLMVMEVGG